MLKQKLWRECLETVDDFGVRITQSVLGGERLGHSHRDGDLKIGDSFVEVKSAGLSNGPIIEEEQLQRNYEASHARGHDYAFVCYKNRGLWRGRTVNLPIRILKSKGKKGLEKFLVLNTQILYVIPVSLVWAMYELEKKNGRVVTHDMKTGPKTYFRVRYPHLKALTETNQSEKPKRFQFNQSSHSVQVNPNTIAKFGKYKVRLKMCRVSIPPVEGDDSFEISDFETPV